MPGVVYMGSLDRNLQRLELGKNFVVSTGDFLSPRVERGKLGKLVKADGRLDISHVVLESRVKYFVVPGPSHAVSLPGVPAHAVQAPGPGLFNGIRETGQHAAFGSRYVFRGVEGKTR